jgi:hypothetical protein
VYGRRVNSFVLVCSLSSHRHFFSLIFSSRFIDSIDWSVCLVTLQHLVSLQARVRTSVQGEVDLHTADRWEERQKKRKCCICSLKRLPYGRRLGLGFFFGFTEVMCAYIHYWSVSGCVYPTIVCHILFSRSGVCIYSLLECEWVCVLYYCLSHSIRSKWCVHIFIIAVWVGGVLYYCLSHSIQLYRSGVCLYSL